MNDQTVTAAEFQRAFGRYSEAAHRAPLTITKRGRASLVLMDEAEYARLQSRREASSVSREATDEEMALLLNSPVPDRLRQYDHEMLEKA